MSEFRIVKNFNEINLGKDWVDVSDFKSKIVDENGVSITANHAGRKYTTIAKKERMLTFCERALRILVVAIPIICTLGIALLLKSVREIIAKKKEIREFGMEIPLPPLKVKSTGSSSNEAKSTNLTTPLRKMDPAQQKLKDFFQKITPANIEEMLDLTDRVVLLGGSTKIEHNFLQIRRTSENSFIFKLNHKDKIAPESPYRLPAQMVQVMDNKFFFHDYKKDETQIFENLDQCLQYLFQGFHYGSDDPDNVLGIAQVKTASLVIATKKEGLVTYKNPFRAVDKMVHYGIHPADCDCEQRKSKG
jgi:hypothetical protein